MERPYKGFIKGIFNFWRCLLIDIISRYNKCLVVDFQLMIIIIVMSG